MSSQTNERTQKRFDLIVFDWDGTLMDSTSMIASSLQRACEDMDLPVPGTDKANHVIGLGLAEALHYLVPQLPDEAHERLAQRYRYHYFTHDHELSLFDGVLPMLNDLREQGYQLAIATGKARRGLDRALEQAGLQTMFDATRCADESFSKPHPAMLLELMDNLYVEPERTVMVGDTTHDIQMAHNAKARAVAVSYGAHQTDVLVAESPLATLGSAVHLHQWFNEIA